MHITAHTRARRYPHSMWANWPSSWEISKGVIWRKPHASYQNWKLYVVIFALVFIKYWKYRKDYFFLIFQHEPMLILWSWLATTNDCVNTYMHAQNVYFICCMFLWFCQFFVSRWVYYRRRRHLLSISIVYTPVYMISTNDNDGLNSANERETERNVGLFGCRDAVNS